MRNTILYIGGFNLPDRNASAIRVMENAHLLKKLGYEVVLMGKLKAQKGSAVYDGFECFDIMQPFTERTYKPYTQSIGSVKDVAAHIGMEKIKAIVAYNYPAFSLEKINRFARKSGIAPVADCTEWYGWEGWRIDRNIKRMIDTAYRMYFSAKNAKNVICAGSYLQKHFASCHTVIWPFCVNTELQRWQLLDKDITINHPRRFVYSGSPGIGMSKDRINLLVEAFYRMKKEGRLFEYLIMGITKEQYLSVFGNHRKMIDFLDDQVKFLGRIPHNEALKTLKSADYSLFIRPDNRVSHAGFPTKVMEAFTLGVPTVTNATSDIADYVNDGVNGFIFPGTDVERIERVLQKAIACEDDLLYRMKESCRTKNPFSTAYFIEPVGRFFENLK